ncbi:MAG: glycosyltransferase [Candidatus Aenigmatarchaeota archaeon]
MKILIGSPISKESAYALDKFIKNQEEIYKKTKHECLTVFASEDIKKLPVKNKNFVLINFKPIIKGKDRVWKIVGARNAIREYFLSKDFDYLVFLDSDMAFEPEIINKLVEKAKEGYDVVYNIYRLKNGQVAYSGFGGTLIKRWVMEKVKFRCYEDNKIVVDEINCFKKDLLRIKAKIWRGLVAKSIHYDKNKKWVMNRKLTTKEKIFNWISDKLLSILPETFFVRFIKFGRGCL